MPDTTAAQQQKLILLEIGANDEGGPINLTSVALVWGFFADKASIAPRLQYYYTLRKCLDVWLGQVWQGDYIEVGAQNEDLSDKRTSLQNMRDNAQKEIEKIEAVAGKSRLPATGRLSTTAPLTPSSDPATAGAIDPNSRRFRGDPLLPPYFNRG